MKTETLQNCEHCAAPIASPTPEHRCGPEMVFCNTRCAAEHALTNYPGTALANMVKTMYPDLARAYNQGRKEENSK